jgi:hypothetical protein
MLKSSLGHHMNSSIIILPGIWSKAWSFKSRICQSIDISTTWWTKVTTSIGIAIEDIWFDRIIIVIYFKVKGEKKNDEWMKYGMKDWIWKAGGRERNVGWKQGSTRLTTWFLQLDITQSVLVMCNQFCILIGIQSLFLLIDQHDQAINECRLNLNKEKEQKKRKKKKRNVNTFHWNTRVIFLIIKEKERTRKKI